MLVAAMFLLFILVISMAVAVPIVKKQIQHDRDVETMHRGKQYARAIRMYYKKFGAYPPNMDALVKTNNLRFLRRKYADPTPAKLTPPPAKPIGRSSILARIRFRQPGASSASLSMAREVPQAAAFQG